MAAGAVMFLQHDVTPEKAFAQERLSRGSASLRPGGGCPIPKPLWAVVRCQESV